MVIVFGIFYQSVMTFSFGFIFVIFTHKGTITKPRTFWVNFENCQFIMNPEPSE